MKKSKFNRFGISNIEPLNQNKSSSISSCGSLPMTAISNRYQMNGLTFSNKKASADNTANQNIYLARIAGKEVTREAQKSTAKIKE